MQSSQQSNAAALFAPPPAAATLATLYVVVDIILLLLLLVVRSQLPQPIIAALLFLSVALSSFVRKVAYQLYPCVGSTCRPVVASVMALRSCDRKRLRRHRRRK